MMLGICFLLLNYAQVMLESWFELQKSATDLSAFQFNFLYWCTVFQFFFYIDAPVAFISYFAAVGVSKTGIVTANRNFSTTLSSHACFSDEVRLFFEQLRAELTSTWTGLQLFYLSDAKYSLEEKNLDGRDASRIDKYSRQLHSKTPHVESRLSKGEKAWILQKVGQRKGILMPAKT
jgi:hypothetical protein